jgi:glycosyltransferase involved in cell wall biosynthesis
LTTGCGRVSGSVDAEDTVPQPTATIFCPVTAPPERNLLVLSADGTAVGGVTRVTLSLTAELRSRGWSVETVYPASIDAARLTAWAGSRGVEVKVSDNWLNPLSGRVRNALGLVRHVRASQATIVNLHYGGSHVPLKDVLAVRLAGRKRCVVTLHAPNPWAETGRARKMMTALASRLCAGVVPVCGAVAEIVGDGGVATDKTFVIPGGVAAPGAVPSREEARTALGISADAFVVGSVARLSPEKGIPYLVDAVADLLPGETPPPFLLIKGDRSSEWETVTELARKRLPGRSLILEADADNELVFAASDIFVLPSLLEGYPLVLMEAAFRGLPCVATHVGSVDDLVVKGETGFVVHPGSAAELSAAIERLRSDERLRATMSENALKRATSEFTESLMADRYERVFLARAAANRIS